MFQTGTSNISKSLRLLIANFASLWEDVLHGHLGLFCGTSREPFYHQANFGVEHVLFPLRFEHEFD